MLLILIININAIVLFRPNSTLLYSAKDVVPSTECGVCVSLDLAAILKQTLSFPLYKSMSSKSFFRLGGGFFLKGNFVKQM